MKFTSKRIRIGVILALISFGIGMSDVAAQAAGKTLTVESRTRQQIEDYISTSGANLTTGLTYSSSPILTAPYAAGALATETQNDGLNMLNTVRYIAGLSDNVTLEDEYCEVSQASAIVNYANGMISHTPSKPAGMSDALHSLGYEGGSNGNLAFDGKENVGLGNTIVHGWMADTGDNNKAVMGHRRWCLNPAMTKTGFGAVTGEKGTFSTMYALDGALDGMSSQGTVVWPAQCMPTEYFSGEYSWSISSSEPFSAENTKVILTRESDDRTWEITAGSEDGDLFINTQNMGMPNCLIFRPNGISTYKDGDIYTVTVQEDGVTTLTYSVTFFSLTGVDESAALSLSYDTIGLLVGETRSLILNVSDESISKDKIDAISSNDNVATVSVFLGTAIDQNGNTRSSYGLAIKGKSAGTAEMTISLPNGSSVVVYATVAEEHTHDTSIDLIVKQPTCTERGLKTQACSVCNYWPISSTLYYVAATGHSYGEYIITEEPTCTTPGKQTATCKNCGEEDVKEAAVVDHIYDTGYTTDKEASCGVAGQESQHCKWYEECGKINEASIREIPALGAHTGGTATCTTKAVCEVCGQEYGELAEHIYSTEWTVDKEPTCTETGVKSRHCTIEGCTAKTDETTVETLEHSGGTATCQEQATCTRCGEKYGALSDHNYNEDYTIDKEATCIETGSQSQHCKWCDAIDEESVRSISATGVHTYSTEWTVDQEPTCTATGVKSHHCTTEGCTAKADETMVDVLGHSGGTATCTQKAKCSICGKEYGGLKTHTPGEWTVTTPATYTSEGERYQKCTECGNILKKEKIPMLQADKGVEVTIDGNSYVVTSTSGTKTVTYGGADAAAGNVTTVKIPAIVQINGQTYKVTAVEADAFKNDTKIKTVIMGPNVTKIGDNAFYGCKNLSKVTLSSKTVSIGKNAFYKCTKLSAITIPATVKTIGTKAFYGCSKLKTITIKSKKLTSKNVGSSAFKGIYNKAKIKVPKAKWSAYKTLLKKKGVSSKAAFKKL